MIGAWVLIASLVTSNGGISMINQEFSSESACETAKADFYNNVGFSPTFISVRKSAICEKK